MKRLALLLALVATPAAAALAPEYYEAARREAPDVIVFEVQRVATPTPLAFLDAAGALARDQYDILDLR